MRSCLFFLLLGGLLGWQPGQAAAQTFEAAALASHKVVAVLPFEATLEGLRMRDLRHLGTADTMSAAQQQEARKVAYQMQVLLYLELLGHQPRHGYQVQFQPVAETNRRLQAAGITYANLASQSMSQLRQALGVDAVLSGQVLLYQSVPKGLGLAVRLLSNEPLLFSNQPSAVTPSQTTANLTLHDCQSGRLAWRFDFARTGPNALKPVRLAPRLVREALPVFPYCQP